MKVGDLVRWHQPTKGIGRGTDIQLGGNLNLLLDESLKKNENTEKQNKIKEKHKNDKNLDIPSMRSSASSNKEDIR